MENPLNRCGLLALFALAVATCASGQGNILLIVADDLGVDNVSVYAEGSDLPPTPNIDALAQAGVLFRNCWANPVCSATRATIITGRYGSRTGVTHVVPPAPDLPLAELTIPEALELNSHLGYTHAAIGKWHLGAAVNGELSPNLQGFSHYAGALPGSLPDYYAWPKTTDGVTTQSLNYATTETVDDALAWISQQAQPWFLYLAFNAPHVPFDAPPPDLHSQALPPESWLEKPRPYYKALVEALDTELGRLLAGLGPQVLQQTTVLFVSDNGTPYFATVRPFVPEHAKATLYEGGLRVPLIISGPGVVAPGRECHALVNTTDLFATVLELAGVDLPSGLPAGLQLDSVSVTPYLADALQPPLRFLVFAEMIAPYQLSIGKNGVAYRDARYKLISFEDGTVELYNLLTDPLEGQPLSQVSHIAEVSLSKRP
jgi:arylsulfatase B